MSRIRDIVICCTSAHTLARFWAAALDGYQIRPYDDAEIARLAALGFTPETDPSVAVDGPGPTLFLQETAEPPPTSGRRPEPTQNQIHLDLEHKVLLGIKLLTQFKRQKIKQMQHLNLLVKWDLIISVFMIQI